MKATVVLPTYDEAGNLPPIVRAILALPIEGIGILVVDDNSPDGTGQIAEELARAFPGAVSVLHRPGKLGLGTAYVQGFARALADGADLVFEMDADFSHPVDALPRMVERIPTCDVVVGSRYVSGGRVDDRWSPMRKWLSRWGSIYSRAILGLRVHDTTAGFKCFRRQAIEQLDLRSIMSNGYAFQVEMAYLCQRVGLRVEEIPIVFADRTQGRSKMSARVALEAAGRVWQIKWRYEIAPSRRLVSSDHQS
ncbi:MAG: polyprenol monophosphomannose synthase [Chloroflexi bacterium]|nr:polyprenol monophosphomannose synthase [Chloroflexota bacterium]